MKPSESFICNWTDCSLPGNLIVPADCEGVCECIADLKKLALA